MESGRCFCLASSVWYTISLRRFAMFLFPLYWFWFFCLFPMQFYFSFALVSFLIFSVRFFVFLFCFNVHFCGFSPRLNFNWKFFSCHTLKTVEISLRKGRLNERFIFLFGCFIDSIDDFIYFVCLCSKELSKCDSFFLIQLLAPLLFVDETKRKKRKNNLKKTKTPKLYYKQKRK